MVALANSGSNLEFLQTEIGQGVECDARGACREAHYGFVVVQHVKRTQNLDLDPSPETLALCPGQVPTRTSTRTLKVLLRVYQPGNVIVLATQWPRCQHLFGGWGVGGGKSLTLPAGLRCTSHRPLCTPAVKTHKGFPAP